MIAIPTTSNMNLRVACAAAAILADLICFVVAAAPTGKNGEHMARTSPGRWESPWAKCAEEKTLRMAMELVGNHRNGHQSHASLGLGAGFARMLVLDANLV